VPLVGRPTLGVVWGPPRDNFAHNRLKDIAHVYDTPPLSRGAADHGRLGEPLHAGAPGMVLRSVLRSSEALEPERPVTAYRLDRARAGADDRRGSGARRRGGRLAWAKAAIVGASGVSPSVIEGLEKAGALERVEIPPRPIVMPPDPDHRRADAQRGAGAALAADPRADATFAVALLDGVTGGGKTEVFFEAVADTLRAGRQALILLPEIALTHTFLARFTRASARARPSGIRT
jgi:primosomal protein N' (replication factor Y) (superfamily II helicase)